MALLAHILGTWVLGVSAGMMIGRHIPESAGWEIPAFVVGMVLTSIWTPTRWPR